MKLQKTKGKELGKKSLTRIKIIEDFLSQTVQAKRDRHEIFKVMKRKTTNLILSPSRKIVLQ
jgi:Mn-dependent DtxR family transcriptional regulator